MKILIYGINYAPELTGVGKYTGEMAEWLAARGHKIRVVTAPPYYPGWQVQPGYRAHRYAKEQRNGVTVWRCPLWVPHPPTGLKRLLHLAGFAVSSFPMAFWQVFWRPDVVWTVEPALFCAPGAWLTARLSGARVWLHIQDYEVDAAFELGLLRGAAGRRAIAAVERCLMRRFDRVSTISERMMQRAQAKRVAPERLVSFPNWVSLDPVSPPDVPNPLRAELGISADETVALYAGTMGDKQGLEMLAEAASLLMDSVGLTFVFCGDGPGREGLMARCLGLPNVRFLGLQPPGLLGTLLDMADIHLLPQRAGAADLVMPSKLSGMLASGRPVVATCAEGTQISEVVRDRGLTVPPGDPEAFARAIRRLAGDAGLRARLGDNARAYAEGRLAQDVVLGQFEKDLQMLVTKGNRS